MKVLFVAMLFFLFLSSFVHAESDSRKSEYDQAELNREELVYYQGGKKVVIKLSVNPPRLISPEDGAIVNTDMIVFKYEYVSPGVLTRIQIAKDSAFTNPVVDTYAEDRIPIDKNETIPAFIVPAPFLEEDVYYWRTKSVKEIVGKDLKKEGDWSGVWSFKVTKTYKNSLDAPNILINERDIKGDNREKLLKLNQRFWSKVKGATHVRIQISKTEQFEQNVFDKTFPIDVKFIKPQVPLKFGRIYFQRVAVCNSDNRSNWSKIRKYERFSPGPILNDMLLPPNLKH